MKNHTCPSCGAKTKKYIPKDGEKAFFIDSSGEVVHSTVWVTDSTYDMRMIAFGNSFSTQKLAEAALDKIKALLATLEH